MNLFDQHTRYWWRRVTNTVGAMLVVATSLLIPAGVAHAYSLPTGENGTYNGVSTHWGNILIDGRYGYCVDPGATPPANLDDANATKICGQTDASGNLDANGQIAYLIGKYDQTSDVETAVSISQLSRSQYHPNIPVTYPATYNNLVSEAKRNGGSHAGLIQVDADNLVVWYGLVHPGETDRDTAHYADGFPATLTITTPNVTFVGGASTINVTTGTSAKSITLVPRHGLVADEPVTVTIDITGIPSNCFLLHNNGPNQQRVATGLVTSASGTTTGKATQTRWQPQITTMIDTPNLTYGTTSVNDLVKADAVGGTQWPVATWDDQNQTQPKTYIPLVASAQIAKTSVPAAPSATLPAGASILPGEPTLVTLTGPGVQTTTTVPLPADPGSGHYSIRWCLDPAYQGGNAKYLPKGGPTCDNWFAAQERFTAPMRINIASTIPNQHQAKSQAPNDTITLTLPDTADQWISDVDGKPVVIKAEGTYYAGAASSFTLANQPPADATILGTASVNVTLPTSGRADVTVPAPAGFTVPTSQYGVWVWRIDKNAQTDNVKPLIAESVSDKFGQTLETHVTQMDLTIASQVKDPAITEPVGKNTTQVCDTVWVEHGSPEDLWLNQWGTNTPVQVVVDGTLYHSAVPSTQTIQPGDVPAVDQWSLTFTAAGQEHAQTVCHTTNYGDYGAYGFQWTINLDHQPKATQNMLANGTVTPLWLPVETTMVKRTPIIHTIATSWDTTNNSALETYLADGIWQTNWPDNQNDTDMYGAVGHGDWAGQNPWAADGKTITVQLWRINEPITPDSCSLDNPNATLIATNTTTPALNTWAGAQTVSGSKFKADVDGTYTFVVSWPGDQRTTAYQSVCGEKSETITIISGKPQFVTQLVAPADTNRSTVDAAQAQDTGITIKPGQELVDMLHAWYPDITIRPAPMDGWQATWQAYYVPADGRDANIVDGPDGTKIYSNAVCTPDTLFWASDQPVTIDKPGRFTSPMFTAPNQPGSLFLVETITDTSQPDQPNIVHRGTCGAVNESAIIPVTPHGPDAQTGGTILESVPWVPVGLAAGIIMVSVTLAVAATRRRHHLAG